MANAEEYKAKLVAYTEGKDPLQMQREAPKLLAELTRGAPDDVLRRSPAPGKWSIAEILAHLADDEIATAWRYRQMVENPGCSLPGFDQDAWSLMSDYASSNPEESLELFRRLREANLRLLERLSPEQWASWGVHLERGRNTVRELACHMAGHDMNHVEQIRSILNGSRVRDIA
jgi:DinB superfamily